MGSLVRSIARSRAFSSMLKCSYGDRRELLELVHHVADNNTGEICDREKYLGSIAG